jgi:alkaline phosphatase
VLKSTVFFILSALTLFSCSPSPKHPTAKSHIFFIVDGMGHAHLTGARIYAGGSDHRLHIESFPVVGLVRTYSSNDYVTDSASSATAYASGVKTYNRSIGLTDPAKTPSGKSEPLPTLLQRAQEAGKSVGIVTTTRVTHATPAAYYAQVPNRNMEQEIAEQLINQKIDLVLGGGRSFFLPESVGGLRKDGRNLLEEHRARGDQVLTEYSELTASQLSLNTPLLGLFEDDHLPYDLNRTDSQLPLSALVEFAITHLSKNPKGYVLIVEPGRVDHASHMNWARLAFGDMLAFDEAIKVTLRLRDSQTLVVVTADHETGGLALNGYAPVDQTQGERLLKNQTRDFANPHYNHGLISWASGPGFDSPLIVDEEEINFRHKATYPAPKNSAYHTAVDVPLFALGPGQEMFNGFHNNNEIVHRVIKILQLSPL